MSESAKTYTLIGVAVVLAALAFVFQPHMTSGELEGQVNEPLFTDWQDASAAKSLQITSVDETTNSLVNFKVADVDGRWVVPSHDNYPADAKDHVFKAASSLIGLRVLAVMSDIPGDQETFGVVEPNEKTLTTSSFSGFGRLVVVKDATGKDLARLIIGKEDKSTAESGSANLRFVRRAGQDRIYRVALDTDVFTTKFQDWVDADILAIKQPWDITNMLLHDYSIEQTINRKADIDLSFDDAKAAWSVKQLTEYKNNVPKVTKLPPTEELDSTKLNDLKSNISGMKLANVTQKPTNFAAKLKSGKLWMGDPEAEASLEDSGFVALPRKNPTDVLGVGGDVTLGMKDGVEYKIRFGGAAMTLKGDSGEKKSAGAKNTKSTSIERAVFVTARFNPDLIPKPMLEPLPAEKKSPEKNAEPKKGESPKPAEKAPAAAPPAAKSSAPAPSPAKAAGANKSSQVRPNLSGDLLALADTADATKPADDKKPAAAPAPKQPAAPSKPADDKSKPAPAAKPAPEQPTSDIKRAEAEEAQEAERKRIETDNRRKQDEYDDAVKRGKARVKELNSRFADWYYMISEDDYKKVHVGLADITKAKAGTEAGPLGPNVQDPFARHQPINP